MAADVIQPCVQCPEGAKLPARYRGLCLGCYQRSRKHVQAGKTTWRALEQAGLALPPKPPTLPGWWRRQP
jgi:hypothetical protein